MADFRDTVSVSATPDAAFDYLREVGNLPEYFPQMTSARLTGPEEVHTTATLHDGSEVEGTAWFRVDDAERTVAWGAPGPHDYQGTLAVADRDGTAEISLTLSTSRVEAGDEGVAAGIAEALATLSGRLGS